MIAIEKGRISNSNTLLSAVMWIHLKHIYKPQQFIDRPHIIIILLISYN